MKRGTVSDKRPSFRGKPFKRPRSLLTVGSGAAPSSHSSRAARDGSVSKAPCAASSTSAKRPRLLTPSLPSKPPLLAAASSENKSPGSADDLLGVCDGVTPSSSSSTSSSSSLLKKRPLSLLNRKPAERPKGVGLLSKGFKPPKPSSGGFKVPRRSGVLPHPGGASSSGASSSSSTPPVSAKYYTVLYCKSSRKKHKTYNDGVLTVKGAKFRLQTMEGKDVGHVHTMHRMAELGGGSQFYMGGNELEVVDKIDADKYESGRIFIGESSSSTSSAPRKKLFSKGAKFRAPSSRVSSSGSLLAKKNGAQEKKTKVAKQRNNPDAPNALVLNEERYRAKLDKSAVVVDSFIGSKLRPHQRAGVTFLYKAVMGIQNQSFNGCILADDMGMGKTIQSISLLWTLLKDGPSGHPVLKKVLIVTPATLVKNWADEFNKWLGRQRVVPVIMESNMGKEKTGEQIKTFVHSTQFPVMIVSYETFKKSAKAICEADVGLLICDEGHRLKNSSGNQTIRALQRVRTNRRILVTGTPVQNDLEELYAMCDFVNAGSLGSLTTFRNIYARPIEKGRDSNCAKDLKALGDERGMELARITSSFILRRTQEVLRKFLPPKTTYVVFCRMSEIQTAIYREFLKTDRVLRATAQPAQALQCINSLCKLANDPSLVYRRCAEIDSAEGTNLCANFPEGYNETTVSTRYSGKLRCLSLLIDGIVARNERIVVVSNKRQTLDVIEAHLRQKDIASLRLDGSTPSQQRMSIANQFNASYCNKNVFLLSAKAGGVGLNLIGANRLVLFDPDWNPATDQQVLARIWRDGQQKPCFVYRLMSVGTIDEKILQRQFSKSEYQDVVNKKSNNTRNFSRDELKRIFSLDDDTEMCNTHDLLRGKLDQWTVTSSANDIEDEVLMGVQQAMATSLPAVFSQTVSNAVSLESPQDDARGEPVASQMFSSDVFLDGESQESTTGQRAQLENALGDGVPRDTLQSSTGILGFSTSDDDLSILDEIGDLI